MNRQTWSLGLLSVMVLVSCDVTSSSSSSHLSSLEPFYEAARLDLFEEAEKSFDFFWETTTQNPSSAGYGLSRDRYPGNPTIASIASVGFALGAYVGGVEQGYITFEQGQERVLGTLRTLKALPRTNGFFYHWIHMATGQREWNSEVSIIDTGLMLAGALTAAEYFGGEIATLTEELYLDVNWDWYVNPNTLMFYMGYKPETGFFGAWDHFAEQLLLYVLAAGNPNFSYGAQLYKRLKFLSSNYVRGYTSTSTGEVVTPFIYTYDGSLFQHQFSHAFIDFKQVRDYQGTDWYDNAVKATRANYLYTLDHAHRYLTYSETSWGISAGDGPNEYRAYGAQPAKNNAHNGTIVPYAATASINYWELESLDAVDHYASIPQLQTTYGFSDAYNLGPVDDAYNPTIANLTPWYDPHVLGIDKGITYLMIENYRSRIIWDMFMQNPYVQDGLSVLEFTQV